MITITLPDGSAHQYEAGVTPLDIARGISEGLARNVLAAKVNNQVVELYRNAGALWQQWMKESIV